MRRLGLGAFGILAIAASAVVILTVDLYVGGAVMLFGVACVLLAISGTGN
jgi:hypothetical protein